MTAMELCPEGYEAADGCKKRFCQYRNKKGYCSLDVILEAKEYEVGEIAEILQTSRQRIWRIYDGSISKLQIILKG